MSQEEVVHNDAYEIPVSAGIPPAIGIAFAVFIGIVIVIMALVIYASGHDGHVWPWTNAAKVPLTSNEGR